MSTMKSALSTGWRRALRSTRPHQDGRLHLSSAARQYAAEPKNLKTKTNKRFHLHIQGKSPIPQNPVGYHVYLADGQLRMTSRKPGDVAKDPFPVPLQWLRDHCSCEKCVHPSTKQRLVETFYEIPADISTKSVEEDNAAYRVVWSDGHESRYSKEWLTAPVNNGIDFVERQGWVKPVLWTGETVKNNPPTVDFGHVMETDEGLLEWLKKIREYGFCYIDNTPVTPEDTEKLLERIAYIRNTHYGGFWDFTSDLSKGDTAYTQLGIGPHTDNTYFSDPAGLQLFHLLSHTDGEGGISGLVDGFAAALELSRRDRDAYRILATINVYSHASGNQDSSIQPYRSFPVLVHDHMTKALLQVRWNTTDRAHIDLSLENVDQWYSAARKWAQILKEFEYKDQLVPGKAMIFDNWRVLHSRSAFTGKRRMCGGYINRDDFISRFKMVKYGREQVLKQISAL